MPVALAASALTGLQATTAYAADPVAGARTAGDAMFPHVGNGGYDALHYDVDIAWNATGVVNGSMTGTFSSASTTMVAETTGAPLSSFSLDFEGLTVDAITVDGVPATWERVQNAGDIEFKLIVTPATLVDGEFTTVVSYHGVPQVHVDPDNSWEGWAPTADGAIFMGQPVGSMAAYPNNNTPGDKATYTFTIDAPSTLTSATGTGPAGAVSNGELASKTVSQDGARTTWEWVQQEQMASELALISIGKYDVVESQVTLSSGRTIPEWTFFDSALTEASKTTIRNRRAQLGAIISRLEQIFGPYPGNSTGVVVDTVPRGINYALETQDRSFFPSVGTLNGTTLIHELTHQWYGDNVSPGLWTDIWINEGMAEWAPLWHDHVLAAATPDPGAVEDYFHSDEEDEVGWTFQPAGSPVWATPPGAQTDPGDLYGYQTYTRGGQFWEALRTVLRDPDFFTVVKRWQIENSGTSPRGDALKALAEEVSGLDLDAFWQDWIYDADKPAWPAKYDVSLGSTPAQGTVAGGTVVTYTISAANVGKVALADGVVKVDLTALTDDATVGSLPAGVTRSGNTLTWVVPSTEAGAAATASFPVTVSGNASSVRETLFATASPASLGGACVSCGAFEAAPRPVVAGTPTVGVPLSAATTGWPAGSTFAYQWSVGGTTVPAATGSTYTPVAGDAAKTVTVAVTGTAPGFAPTRRVSTASAAVATGTLTSTPTPTLSGTPQVGVAVTALPGAWDADTTFAYRWTVAGVDVATTPSYTPVAGDAGKAVAVAVTGSKAGYAPVTRTSASVNVTAGTPTLTPTPVLSGPPAVGSPVTVTPGTWDDGTTLAYQWKVGGNVLEGVIGTTFTPRPVDAGKALVVTVTATRAGYATVSRATEAVEIAAGTLASTPTPTLDGTPAVGTSLSAVPGTWDAGVTLGYRWLVGGQQVGTAPSYTPVAGDLGKPISVAVTGTRAGYAAVTRTSEAVTVVAGTLTSTPVPTVSGPAVFGSRLTAAAGSWDAGVALAHQWLRNGSPIAGATGASYVPVVADLGTRLTVAVTGTKPGYTAVTETSAPTAAVATATFASAKARVVGALKVGRTLTAKVIGASGAKVTYVWTAGTKKVGAGPKLKLAKAMAGTRITLTVTLSAPGYATRTLTVAKSVVRK